MPQAVEWLNYLPSLDSFENVICDNLPEILHVRQDAIISAQFFWHNAIEKASKDYTHFCDKLLSQHKPTIIGCEHFSMGSVVSQPGFKPVGLYKNPDLLAAAEAPTREPPTDLLVTGGTTEAVRIRMQYIINQLLKTGPESYQNVHVDPELMPYDAPTWMLKADFSNEMYCKLKAAICRPGLGVITDLITVGASIYPVYELHKLEMVHNARSINAFYQNNTINQNPFILHLLSSFH